MRPTSAWVPTARRCWCARAACRWKLALVVAPLVAAVGAFVYGWFAVRLSGVYLAMLTLAFAQITWAITYQWDAFTGGSNGLTGVWPSEWLSDKRAYYWLTLVLVAAGRAAGCAACCSRPSAMRCARAAIRCCAPTRSASTSSACSGRPSSSPARRRAWPGALYAFSKGSISPESAERGQVGRRPGDGAARRHPDAGRPGGGRGHLHLAARHRGAQHRLLARDAGRASSCCWCCCSRRASRASPSSCSTRAPARGGRRADARRRRSA